MRDENQIDNKIRDEKGASQQTENLGEIYFVSYFFGLFLTFCFCILVSNFVLYEVYVFLFWFVLLLFAFACLFSKVREKKGIKFDGYGDGEDLGREKRENHVQIILNEKLFLIKKAGKIDVDQNIFIICLLIVSF